VTILSYVTRADPPFKNAMSDECFCTLPISPWKDGLAVRRHPREDLAQRFRLEAVLR